MARRRSPRRPPPPSALQALRAFKAAIFDARGEFIETVHFRERMAQRDCDSTDVEHLAREGRILNPPEWDIAHGEWKWRMEGQAVDGKTVYVVFSLQGPNRVKGNTIETPGR